MNKVALVSGALHDIGLAVARELHARGYRLLLGLRNPGRFESGLAGDPAVSRT